MAEDLTQEVFLEIWESGAKLHEVQSIKAYLSLNCAGSRVKLMMRLPLRISKNAIKNHMVATMKVLSSAVEKDLGISLSVLLAVLLK